MNLEVGEVYKRTDIQDHFGGQRQGGISTPKNAAVVMIFSSEAGENYGYEDGWVDPSTFRYTGEGQVGDMQWRGGNSAIRDHEKNGRRLLLFQYVRKAYVRFEGEMRCVEYESFLTPDRNGKQRDALRFILERVNDRSEKGTQGSGPFRYRKPNRTERQGLVTSRVGQGYYRQQILEKFDGQCAVTGCGIQEILIASHILAWRQSSEEDRLDVENGILLSPNYDALFDRHLISFQDDGSIILSKLLTDHEIDAVGINRKAAITVTDGMKPFLSLHRKALR
ncbi:MAG: HNH endonuclease [Verrucomicrobiota bacterium]